MSGHVESGPASCWLTAELECARGKSSEAPSPWPASSPSASRCVEGGWGSKGAWMARSYGSLCQTEPHPTTLRHQLTPHFHTCWPIAGPVPAPGSPAGCRQRSGPATRTKGNSTSAQLNERPACTHRKMASLTLMSTRSSATIFRACVCCLRTASCKETCSMRALAAPASTTVGAVPACERAVEHTYSSPWHQPGFSLRRKNI